MLMRWGIVNDRKSRSKLKTGVCGEHMVATPTV